MHETSGYGVFVGIGKHRAFAIARSTKSFAYTNLSRTLFVSPQIGEMFGSTKGRGFHMEQKEQNSEPEKDMPKWKNLLQKAGKRYLIDAMGSMAYGLFASLLIGTILKTIFDFIHIPALEIYFQQIIYWTKASSPLVGAAIGVAVAHGMKSKPLVIYSAATVGGIAYMMNSINVLDGTMTGEVSAGPAGAVLAVIIAVEIGSLIYDKTPVNIIAVPAGCVLSGTAAAMFIGPPISAVMNGLGTIIMNATTLYPLPMGIAVALLVGFTLVAPISSAALCMMLSLSGLAAGAATAGCCSQMIGFAVASYRENGVNGLFAQGIGTAKIQFPNVVRRPVTIIPTALASAVCGALSTCVFKMTNNPQGAGMGSCGLVGQITTWTDMSQSIENRWTLFVSILILQIIIPALIAYITSEIMRKKGWLKFGDLKLAEN